MIGKRESHYHSLNEMTWERLNMCMCIDGATKTMLMVVHRGRLEVDEKVTEETTTTTKRTTHRKITCPVCGENAVELEKIQTFVDGELKHTREHRVGMHRAYNTPDHLLKHCISNETFSVMKEHGWHDTTPKTCKNCVWYRHYTYGCSGDYEDDIRCIHPEYCYEKSNEIIAFQEKYDNIYVQREPGKTTPKRFVYPHTYEDSVCDLYEDRWEE